MRVKRKTWMTAGLLAGLTLLAGCWTVRGRGGAVLSEAEKQAMAQEIAGLRARADRGDAPAARRLGEIYASGEAGDFDYPAALKYSRQAAEGGEPEGYYQLALLYLYGDGVEQSYPEAVRYLELANTPSAWNALGVIAQQGNPGEADLAAAAEWYRRAAEAGLPVAQCNYAACLFSGSGVAADRGAAMEWFEKAWRNGDSTAGEWLGMIYLKGLGVPVDRGKAQEYLQCSGTELEELARRPVNN